MIISKGWEAIHQSDQGICFFDSHFEIIYKNEKAEKLFGYIGAALVEQFRHICRQVTKQWEITPNSIINYSGILKYSVYNGIHFNCFSFSQSGRIFICFAFNEQSLSDCEMAGHLAFTPREREILQEVKQGRTNREISEALYISLETVKSHIRNILAKTGASSRTELLGKVLPGISGTMSSR